MFKEAFDQFPWQVKLLWLFGIVSSVIIPILLAWAIIRFVMKYT